ncbi:MAG: hypothetical protein KatS3mg123_0280 [Burkholderiales bacterium]|nr:MAG: hypothetical protein KatS3mg123_0280 [Burkholderiales bacterium]
MNARKFISEKLSSTGWSPVDAELAKFLEPGVSTYWKDFEAFKQTPGVLLAMFPGIRLCRVRTSDFGDVLVACRSTDALAQRIAWVLGCKVEAVDELDLEAPQQRVVARPERGERPKDKTPELIALARKEPPVHDCHLRREIMRARASLDAMAVEWREEVAE